MSKRIFFNYNNNKISSSGVLLYYIKDNDLFLLLSESKRGLEDLGGRIDIKDKDYFETAAREAWEESNNKLNKRSLLSRIKKSKIFVNKHSYYILFIVKANNKEINLKEEDFGDIEIEDNIKRKIKWVNYDYFKKHKKINFRLKTREILEEIKNLFIKSTSDTNIKIVS